MCNGSAILIRLAIIATTAAILSMPPAGSTPALAEKAADSDLQAGNLAEVEKRIAALDENESKWYQRFQQGILMFDGWQDISRRILAIFPADMQPAAELLTRRLGIKIGTEWCRDNEVRRIDTDMLKAWGDRLRDAARIGPDSTARALAEIEYEVDEILRSGAGLASVAPQS